MVESRARGDPLLGIRRRRVRMLLAPTTGMIEFGLLSRPTSGQLNGSARSVLESSCRDVACWCCRMLGTFRWLRRRAERRALPSYLRYSRIHRRSRRRSEYWSRPDRNGSGLQRVSGIDDAIGVRVPPRWPWEIDVTHVHPIAYARAWCFCPLSSQIHRDAVRPLRWKKKRCRRRN